MSYIRLHVYKKRKELDEIRKTRPKNIVFELIKSDTLEIIDVTTHQVYD